MKRKKDDEKGEKEKKEKNMQKRVAKGRDRGEYR